MHNQDILTIEQVRQKVEKIKRGFETDPGDYWQHEEQDKLYEEILEAIAHDRIENAKECARLALVVRDLDFKRYYS